MATICVFGDSTAWGAWDLEKGGWVNRLWLFLAEKDQDAELYNLSISGGTSETILARFENEAKIREADILVFQTGGNDAAGEHTEDNYQVPPDKFKENLEEIIRRAKKMTDRIIFIGFKNVDEAKTKPVPWRDIYYTNKNIKKYNEIMKKVCVEQKVLFLDLFGILENKDLDDGVHPNTKGHQKIYERVRIFLMDNKVI
ncbi:MAG: hypothetical protein HZB99_00325 [Candidatus Harrisonbacteria bacterium]|nr:hypothetical protein [Candidatus Harrisonbacteria bacterium]